MSNSQQQLYSKQIKESQDNYSKTTNYTHSHKNSNSPQYKNYSKSELHYKQIIQTSKILSPQTSPKYFNNSQINQFSKSNSSLKILENQKSSQDLQSRSTSKNNLRQINESQLSDQNQQFGSPQVRSPQNKNIQNSNQFNFVNHNSPTSNGNQAYQLQLISSYKQEIQKLRKLLIERQQKESRYIEVIKQLETDQLELKNKSTLYLNQIQDLTKMYESKIANMQKNNINKEGNNQQIVKISSQYLSTGQEFDESMEREQLEYLAQKSIESINLIQKQSLLLVNDYYQLNQTLKKLQLQFNKMQTDIKNQESMIVKQSDEYNGLNQKLQEQQIDFQLLEKENQYLLNFFFHKQNQQNNQFDIQQNYQQQQTHIPDIVRLIQVKESIQNQ